MTELIPCYETEGALTVCPCCGGNEHIGDGTGFACWSCFAHSEWRPRNWSNKAEARAEWARIGLELRRAGKLPPLKEARPVEEPQRSGVWCEDGRIQYGWVHGVNGDDVYVTQQGAEMLADRFGRARPGYVYTVKPYPDTKQTSEAGASGHGTPADSLNYGQSHPKTETAPPLPATLRGSEEHRPAEGGAAKVDPYASHRLAGERRRAELVKARPHWAARLAEATERLEVIDRELERLDRTERKS